MNEDAIVNEIISKPERCSICEQLDAVEFDYMCKVQHQVKADASLRKDFIEKGVCNHHFWKIATLTSPETVAYMGIAFIEEGRFPLNSCLICEHLRERETELFNQLKDAVASGHLDDRIKLCQPHFRSVVVQLGGKQAGLFPDIQRLHNEQLLKELRGFVEKRDCRAKRDKNESTSWWRSVEKIVGRKGMVS
jgi:hypothetical protein